MAVASHDTYMPINNYTQTFSDPSVFVRRLPVNSQQVILAWHQRLKKKVSRSQGLASRQQQQKGAIEMHMLKTDQQLNNCLDAKLITITEEVRNVHKKKCSKCSPASSTHACRHLWRSWKVLVTGFWRTCSRSSAVFFNAYHTTSIIAIYNSNNCLIAGQFSAGALFYRLLLMSWC